MNRSGCLVVVAFTFTGALAGCKSSGDAECRTGNTQTCGSNAGRCETGQQICIEGHWSDCSGTMPTDETCNGLDDDCDGMVDEDCPCKIGDTKQCGETIGLCEPGVQRCTSGMWGQTCEDISPENKRVGPQQEVCDGQDDDCDGMVDEDCPCKVGDTKQCGETMGLCKPGVQRCTNGNWGMCEDISADNKRVLPQPEVCDGDDNDCDGQTDEGCDCTNGDSKQCGQTLGLCKPGVQRCTNGKWGMCEDISADKKYVPPQIEVCDGQDNDCDGDVDEGCNCTNGDSKECGPALGLCKPGVQRCTNGRWGACEDISADRKYVPPQTEVCDGQDNDCDGDVDEGCDCRLGATRWCNGGLGLCVSGKQNCDAGYWGPCVPAQPAGPELCDGLDNDCDGVPDDGFNLDVPCSSMGKCPQARACSTDGKSSGCVDDPRLFSDENCDGIDNDCDGLVDRVAEGGVLRSVCECQDRPLPIGKVVDASIPNNQNLCAPTVCTGDKPRGLLVDGHCYPACLRTDSDSDGDGWGWENGATCLVETSMRGMAAPPCDSLPLGLAMTYCLNCNVTDALPYAMCQSVPQFDLRAFGRGELWLKVDYTYNAAGPAQAPINLWFTTSIGRKHLPLVRMGDLPGHYEVLLRADDACFTPSTAFGSACTGIARDAVRCGHCGSDEVCGALTQCGGYDLSQAWLQVAAEFCARNSGQHKGTVTVHHADLVEQNCQP